MESLNWPEAVMLSVWGIGFFAFFIFMIWRG